MPTGRFRANRERCLLHLVGTLSLASCSGPSTEQAASAQPTEQLPVYDQEAAQVFDDSIAPEVFGLQVERTNPAKDRVLRARSRGADHITRVKLRTILEERFAESLRYRIVVQPLEEPIFGGTLPAELELTVGRASPSLSMLRTMSVEAVGAKFILLLKRYQLNSEPVFHFRGEPDQADVLAAIRQANTTEP